MATITKAGPVDLPEILRLLERCGLPQDTLASNSCVFQMDECLSCQCGGNVL
jgi:hypothetical protein